MKPRQKALSLILSIALLALCWQSHNEYSEAVQQKKSAEKIEAKKAEIVVKVSQSFGKRGIEIQNISINEDWKLGDWGIVNFDLQDGTRSGVVIDPDGEIAREEKKFSYFTYNQK